MSPEDIDEPDAEAFEESDAARSMESQQVAGEYVAAFSGQDPEAGR
jgi:hypothetical protein